MEIDSELPEVLGGLGLERPTRGLYRNQIIQNSAKAVVKAKLVQGAEEMPATRSDTFHRINDAMFGILDRLPK